jgi:type IV secretory pathway VirB10-like protein
MENVVYTVALLSLVGSIILAVKSLISLIKRTGKAKKQIKLSGIAFAVCIAGVIWGGSIVSHSKEVAKQKALAAYHASPEYKAKVAKEKAEEEAKLKAEEAKKKAEQIKKAKEEAKRKAEEIAKKKAEEAKKAEEEKKAKIEAEQQAKIAKIKKVGEEYNNWINSQFDPWDGSHIQLTELIKQNMNNPDSFKHVETTYTNLGLHVGIKVYETFRGTNAFGGVVTNQAIATVDYKTNRIQWHFAQ